RVAVRAHAVADRRDAVGSPGPLPRELLPVRDPQRHAALPDHPQRRRRRGPAVPRDRVHHRDAPARKDGLSVLVRRRGPQPQRARAAEVVDGAPRPVVRLLAQGCAAAGVDERRAVPAPRRDGRASAVRRAGLTMPGAALVRTCAALLACALALAACAHRGTSAPSGVLRVGVEVEPTTLAPILAESITDNEILRLIYDPLIGCDRLGNPVPALAAAVPTRANGGISADGLTIAYRLRRGVRFHDGRPFTSADVAASFRAVM